MRPAVKSTISKYTEHNPLAPHSAGTVFSERSPWYEAVVVDVVVNDDHPEYAMDGYNVGAVKVRLLKSDAFKGTENLNWAFPLETNISDYPLLNEIVWVFSSLNRYYYSRKINLGNSSTSQAFMGLENELKPIPSNNERIRDIKFTPAIAKKEQSAPSQELGKYFQELPIEKLRHWEGDILYEGRSGQSIRLGTSWLDSEIHKSYFPASKTDQSPQLILRVGPYSSRSKDSYKLTVEDINKDLSSLWMVSDTIIPLKPASETNTDTHVISVTNFPKRFEGPQLVSNTDWTIQNSRKKHILFTGEGAHISTLQDFSADSERNSFITTGENVYQWAGKNTFLQASNNFNIYSGANAFLSSKTKFTITSGKFYLGGASATEPMVLGNVLVGILKDIIDAHLDNSSMHGNSSMGPVFLGPGVSSSLRSVKAKLESILSQDNFVAKTNSKPPAISSRKNQPST